MVENNLKETVRKKLEEHKMSSAELERKAGLSATSVRKIILGNAQNPTLETLVAIAEVFKCSLDELVSNKKVISKNLDEIGSSLEWKGDLMLEIIKHSIFYFEKNKIKMDFKKAIKLLSEIYNYCMVKKRGDFDPAFQEWYLQKFLEEKEDA